MAIIRILHKIETNKTHTFLAACRHIHFVNNLQNKALRGRATLKTVQAKAFDTCQIKCYLEDDCVSINFVSNGTCDLNNIDHTQKPDDLVEALDTIYSYIEVSAT